MLGYSKEVDLLADSTTPPLVYFAPGVEFKFELEFENPEGIKDLYVTSTRNNITKYLKAEYNEKTGKQLMINDVDWSQSRIIFVSPVFTPYQLNATDFKNIPIDLYKVSKYEDNIIDVELIQKVSNTKIEEIKVESFTNQVSREVKVYTEEDHLSNRSDFIKELYEELKERILELDDIDIDVKKMYIAFKGTRNIVDLEFYKSKIMMFINMKKGTLNDPLNITIDLSNCGHHGNGDYCVDITNKDMVDNLIPLIKQSLEVNKK